MTVIPGFAATHSRSRTYHDVHATFMALGEALNGTPVDQRDFLEDSTQFRFGPLDVYTNHAKQQVVLVDKRAPNEADGTYIDADFQADLTHQVYRTVMKPNRWGVLEVTERVDTHGADGERTSWMRRVETDAASGAFDIQPLITPK